MELVTSEWLNSEFMKIALRNSGKDSNIEVLSIQISAATSKGDNYGSDMYRVTVEFTCDQCGRTVTEKRSVIVKVAPITEGIRKDMVQQAGLFNVEINMMTTTLKEMQALVPEAKLSGNCLCTREEDPVALVIEDLAPLGFRMGDRQAGLDYQHCVIALKGLARFHASSVACYEKTPNYKTVYNKGIFHNEQPVEMKRFFTSNVKALAKTVATWPELGKKYADKIDKLADVIYQRAANCTLPDESEFNVINHGDFWVNNMLFRYDESGKVMDHTFVDFQLCVYGSPAIDINYFFNTSVSEDVLSNHRNDFVDEYLKVLPMTMRQVGCKTKPPNLSDLQEALKKKEMVSLICACASLPLSLLDKSEAHDFDELMGQNDSQFNNRAYENPAYKKAMLRRLPQWEVMGLLD